jgi:hypothetical protein
MRRPARFLIDLNKAKFFTENREIACAMRAASEDVAGS